ncbi:MAG: TSCPD domain-containing protein [Clostridiales bacterium]|nr:TSCPD domain-containing protein [Clostridiales bacterium]
MTYKTSGVCSTEIELDIEEESEVIRSVRFKNGCAGNAIGLTKALKKWRSSK